MEVKPGYKQTEVGVIPEDWKVCIIGNIADIIDPQPDHRTPPEISGGEPYIGISDFTGDNFVDWNNCRKIIPKAVDKQQASFHICLGDIVFGKIGTIGSPKFLPITPFRYALSANIILIKPKIAPYFVMAWLRSNLVRKNINQELHSTSQAAFGINKMRSLLIPLPRPAEQRAIAEALSDADALIESLEQLIAKKRHVKQGAMQELLTGKTRLPGFSGEWEMKRLGDLADIDPEQLASDTRPDYEFKYISLEDVDCGSLRGYSPQVFSSAPSRARRRLRYGDVLISTVRPNLKSHLWFQESSADWICSTGFAVVRCQDKLSQPGYIFAHLFADSIVKQIETLLTGSNYPAINSRDVRQLEILIPSLKEQTAIAAILSDMDAEIAALEAKLGKARQIKQGMMQELLTGRIRLWPAVSPS